MAETLGFHALAGIFPLLEGQQFRELVEDIRVHGLREPIVIHEGLILDGRNRYRACAAAQVSARFELYKGKDALAFVVSSNLHRRHLDAGQRALIAAEVVDIKGGRRGPVPKVGRRGAGGRLLPQAKSPRVLDTQISPAGFSTAESRPVSFHQAGELMGVSAPMVRKARHLLDNGVPELVEAVRAGDAAVEPAQELAALPQEQQRRILQSDGASVVRIIGRQVRTERLNQRRASRASEAVNDRSVFDFFKVRDGRSIGNVRIGELERLAEEARLEAELLSAMAGHFASANHGDRVRDVFSASVLSELIAQARGAGSHAAERA